MDADARDVSQARSRNMSRIRGRNTGPELRVRSLLHRAGYRFRLHGNDLPGSPDIVLPRYRTAIFVHGCFWHRHTCRKGTSLPKTRREFWQDKLARNRDRDEAVRGRIEDLGWRVIVVWECELRNPERVIARLDNVLSKSERRS